MVGCLKYFYYLCRMNLSKYCLLIVAAAQIFFTAQAKDDVVPTIHRDIHKQLQQLQQESQSFLSMVDSVISSKDIKEEQFQLFPALDLYAEWQQGEETPLWDQSVAIPATFDVDVSKFVAPTVGRLTSPFGWRRRRMHKGVDLKLYVGDTVRAAFDGKVRIRKYERRGYGYYYVIRHNNGLETVYGHLSKQLVGQDVEVKAGQAIGLGGNTGRSSGSHLHFEMRFMGIALDPAEIIDFDSFKPKSDIYAFKRSYAEWAQNNKGRRGAKFRESKSRNNITVVKNTASSSTSKNTATNSGSTKPSSGSGVHVVKQGDTLSRIAAKHGTTVERLCRLNGIKETKTLQLGQKIRYK